jgi:hypothetical protein
MPQLKTFGTGKSAFQITPEEVTIFAYNVSSPDSIGVMTHLSVPACNPLFRLQCPGPAALACLPAYVLVAVRKSSSTPTTTVVYDRQAQARTSCMPP